MCPRKQGEAKVYCSGIQSIDCVLDINSEVIILIQGACFTDEGLCEIRVDAPVSDLVGVGPSVECYTAVDSHVLEF